MAPPTTEETNAVVRKCEKSSLTDSFLGGLAVASFVIIWVSSLISPVLLLQAIHLRSYTATTTIMFVTIMAYAPWEKGILCKSIGNFYNHYHARYYNSYRLIMNAPKKKTFYAVHPHGAFCLGWSTIFVSPFFESVRFCFSPALYYSPFFKLFSRVTGKPGKADKASMISYLKRGESVALPPGGFEEATLSSLNHDRVYIRKRVGFVKLCLQYGYSIVPIYCFGEKDTFWNVQGMWKLRFLWNKWGLPAILVWGKWCSPLLPKSSANLHVVAGTPLELPLLKNPTRDEVKDWHDKYTKALEKVFDDYKVEYYGKEVGSKKKLEIW